MSVVFDSFYDEVNSAVTNNQLNFFKNSDRRHNAAILRVMLNYGNDISLYCGEMSILRNGFYEHINNDYPMEGDYIRPLISEAFQNFVNGNHRIRIILEDYNPAYFDDLIFDIGVLRNPNVELYTLPEGNSMKREIKHFSFSDDQRIVRLEELGHDNHQATCMTGTEEPIDSIYNAFNGLLSIARRIRV